MRELSTDVLIIGTGGAGCRAAIQAADCGVSVLLVNKGTFGRSGTTAYQVAEMAGYNFGDVAVDGDTERHFSDIVAAGQGMADKKLAAILACEAPQTVKDLEKWGVTFEKSDSGYYIFKSCFSNSPRTHVIRGHGEPIIEAEKAQVLARSNIKIINNISITELATVNGRCVGACGISDGGEDTVISAGAVVMATGGSGRAFANNMNPKDITGDGYAMAYRAGAALLNMEFMQIGIGFSWPIVNIFNGYLWEGMPGVLGKNGADIFRGILPEGLSVSEVMHEHRRHFPFSTSDNSKYLEIAVQKAITSGLAAEHGGIRTDFSHMTDGYVKSLKDDCGIGHMWFIAKEYMKSKNVDILQDHLEISCFAHAVNGGIKIDANAMSTIEGLFAAGECAGGPHGADRLGGNMMVTCQVFGRIAGENAAAYAVSHKRDLCAVKAAAETDFIAKRKIECEPLLHSLRQKAQQHLLVDRTEDGLTKFLNFTKETERALFSAPASDTKSTANIDLWHMLTTTALMAQSALARKESRGAHCRTDYPEKNDLYSNPYLIKQKS